MALPSLALRTSLFAPALDSPRTGPPDAAGELEQDLLGAFADLLDAVRNDRPYNEVRYGVEASVVCNMGRRAAHTGREVTFEETLGDDREYAPGADKFTIDSPAPVQAGFDGKYPVPMPGIVTDREY